MNTKKIVPMILLFCFAITSCSPQEVSPPVHIDSEYLNNQIKLRVANYSNTFKTSNSIHLEMKYNTNREIVFPNNYNIRLFYRLDSKWIEVSEKTTERYPKGDIVFSPTAYAPPVEVVVVFPDLPEKFKEYDLRIYVMGDMKSDNDGIAKVAAYVDITLLP